jgi:hypothetical protein
MFALATTRTSPHLKQLLRTANQSLAKQNRKPSQAIENNHQRPQSIASFCRVFLDYACLVAPEFPTPNGNVNGAQLKLAATKAKTKSRSKSKSKSD